jgi:hypothetical protein
VGGAGRESHSLGLRELLLPKLADPPVQLRSAKRNHLLAPPEALEQGRRITPDHVDAGEHVDARVELPATRAEGAVLGFALFELGRKGRPHGTAARRAHRVGQISYERVLFSIHRQRKDTPAMLRDAWAPRRNADAPFGSTTGYLAYT